MYVVELDRSKRLLVISAVQRVTSEQAKLAARRVRELLQDVAPGLRVLADYRSLDLMDSAAARHIAEIMDALAEKGVASVTRVIPDPHKDIGLNILSQFHYGPEIQIATFQTLLMRFKVWRAPIFPRPNGAPRALSPWECCLCLPFGERPNILRPSN